MRRQAHYRVEVYFRKNPLRLRVLWRERLKQAVKCVVIEHPMTVGRVLKPLKRVWVGVSVHGLRWGGGRSLRPGMLHGCYMLDQSADTQGAGSRGKPSLLVSQTVRDHEERLLVEPDVFEHAWAFTGGGGRHESHCEIIDDQELRQLANTAIKSALPLGILAWAQLVPMTPKLDPLLGLDFCGVLGDALCDERGVERRVSHVA
jgi:hypothetical protein